MDLLATGTGWTNVKLNSLFKEVIKWNINISQQKSCHPS